MENDVVDMIEINGKMVEIPRPKKFFESKSKYGDYLVNIAVSCFPYDFENHGNMSEDEYEEYYQEKLNSYVNELCAAAEENKESLGKKTFGNAKGAGTKVINNIKNKFSKKNDDKENDALEEEDKEKKNTSKLSKVIKFFGKVVLVPVKVILHPIKAVTFPFKLAFKAGKFVVKKSVKLFKKGYSLMPWVKKKQEKASAAELQEEIEKDQTMDLDEMLKEAEETEEKNVDEVLSDVEEELKSSVREETLKRTIEQLQKETEKLKEENEKLAEEKIKLNNSNNSIISERDKLLADTVSKDEEVESLNDENKRLLNDLTKLEEENKFLQDEVQSISEKNKELNSKVWREYLEKVEKQKKLIQPKIEAAEEEFDKDRLKSFKPSVKVDNIKHISKLDKISEENIKRVCKQPYNILRTNNSIRVFKNGIDEYRDSQVLSATEDTVNITGELYENLLYSEYELNVHMRDMAVKAYKIPHYTVDYNYDGLINREKEEVDGKIFTVSCTLTKERYEKMKENADMYFELMGKSSELCPDELDEELEKKLLK